MIPQCGADPHVSAERARAVSSNVIRMVEEDINQPNFGPDAAEGTIEGDPIERAHEYYARDGNTSGVWDCSPGRMLEEQHAEDEFCTIIAGRVGIVDNETGTEEIFVAGDSFFLPKGSSLTWIVYETVRKFYMTAE
jgi:uncharacterized cupin superfamily protein